MKWRIYADGRPTEWHVDASDAETAYFKALAGAQTGTFRGEPSVRPLDADEFGRTPDLHPAIRRGPRRRPRSLASSGTRRDLEHGTIPKARLPLLAAITITVVLAVTLSFATGLTAPPRSKEALQAGGRGDGLPAGLDTLMTLADLRERIGRCRDRNSVQSSASPEALAESTGTPRKLAERACAGVIYVWSPLMPLSRLGVADIAAATQGLGIDLVVIDASELYSRMPPATTDTLRPAGEAHRRGSEEALVAEMVAAGATIHYPAILVYRDGRLAGSAIVGYKTAETYRAMVEQRLASLDAAPAGTETLPSFPDAERSARLAIGVRESETDLAVIRDYPAWGRPGAYFRWVPGWNALAYESSRTIHLLDLTTGVTSIAPGFIDFVPSPDGRIFVTPAPDRAGLEFYDAEEVFEAARRGRGAEVEPFYLDPLMRDQYPSVGLLERTPNGTGTRTTYRVMTSWFDKVVYRDYEVVTGGASRRRRTARALSYPVVGCPNLQVSLPILAPNGRQLAGRDEVTATTKILALDSDGICTEVLDLEVQTGKAAWHGRGNRIAFAIPERPMQKRGSYTIEPGAGTGRELAGVFILDTVDRRLTRVSARRMSFASPFRSSSGVRRSPI